MQSDHDLTRIRAVITDYLDGMIYGDADRLRRAFHPLAIAAGAEQGQYSATPREAFISEWLSLEALPRGTAFAAEILSIDVTGEAAVAKVTNTCFGDDYTDYLTLYRIDARWQIIAKAWFAHPRRD